MTSRHVDGRLGLFAAVLASVVALDQITKLWALDRLATSDIDVAWLLRLNLARNYGASFSVGGDSGQIFGIFGLVVAIGLLVVAMSFRSTALVATFGAITGGVLGNIVDRIFRAEDGPFSGAVVDFIDFGRWPIFNVADSAIVCGGVALAVLMQRGAFDVHEVAHIARPVVPSRPMPASAALLERFDAESFRANSSSADSSSADSSSADSSSAGQDR